MHACQIRLKSSYFRSLANKDHYGNGAPVGIQKHKLLLDKPLIINGLLTMLVTDEYENE